jgi:hypothetical protein
VDRLWERGGLERRQQDATHSSLLAPAGNQPFSLAVSDTLFVRACPLPAGRTFPRMPYQRTRPCPFGDDLVPLVAFCRRRRRREGTEQILSSCPVREAGTISRTSMVIASFRNSATPNVWPKASLFPCSLSYCDRPIQSGWTIGHPPPASVRRAPPHPADVFRRSPSFRSVAGFAVPVQSIVARPLACRLMATGCHPRA